MADYVCMYLYVAGCDDNNAGVDVDEKGRRRDDPCERGREKVCNDHDGKMATFQ